MQLWHCPCAQLRARGTTKRCLAYPLGDGSVGCVKQGNHMVARCCLLILLCAARGIFWCLEQPRGSLLEYHPAFQLLMAKVRVYRKFIRMIDYGAESEKGTWLYSGPESFPNSHFLEKFKELGHLFFLWKFIDVCG